MSIYRISGAYVDQMRPVAVRELTTPGWLDMHAKQGKDGALYSDLWELYNEEDANVREDQS